MLWDDHNDDDDYDDNEDDDAKCISFVKFLKWLLHWSGWLVPVVPPAADTFPKQEKYSWKSKCNRNTSLGGWLSIQKFFCRSASWLGDFWKKSRGNGGPVQSKTSNGAGSRREWIMQIEHKLGKLISPPSWRNNKARELLFAPFVGEEFVRLREDGK